MNAQADPHITLEEYFAIEERTGIKHEYDGRRVYAMTGASIRHNRIVGNIFASLRSQLRSSACDVFLSDLRLKIEQKRIYTYPDLSVICGPPELTGDRPDTVTNPIVLVEVLSPSTEHYDRGLKFERYRTIESLNAYLLIAQDRVHAELYIRRADNSWLLVDFYALDQTIPLAAIDCGLALGDIYDNVTLGEEAE